MLRQESPPRVRLLRGCGGKISDGSFPVQNSTEDVTSEREPTKGERFGQDGIYYVDRFGEETYRSNILDMKKIGVAGKIDFRQNP